MSGAAPPPGPLRHDVVIATKDRPAELAACLASLAHQDRQPAVVWVIDAGADDGAADACRAAPAGLEVRHVRAPAGTGRQRNLGIDRSDADVLHFLDDDVILEPGYLTALAAVYDADRASPGDPDQVLGVGGLPTNLPPPRRHQRARPGSVLRSGRGVPVLRADRDLDVDWLSGCCMSFRRRALEHERFDPAPGYALGEDLDLSYRVRQRGRLVVTPAGRLVHLESPRNRWGRRRWARTDVVNRARRVRAGTGRSSRPAFWLDAVAQAALWAARGLRPGARDARALARGMAEGLWAVARGEARRGP